MLALLAAFVVGISAGPAAASSATAAPDDGEVAPAEESEAEGDPALDALLQEGAQVYSQVCSSCHQPGGTGLPGQYPPLVDNPHVDDAGYVAEVIENGRRGEIVVGDETFDGVMPSFSTLDDDETEAVIAYIQNDFQAPQAAVEAFEATGPTAGTELPALANLSAVVAYVLAAAVVGLVLAPRLISANSRLDTPWLDTWLKTAAIVSAVVLGTVIIPDWALKTSAVSELSRVGQDVIGSGLWGLGLLAVLGGLWYAHRESRI